MGEEKELPFYFRQHVAQISNRWKGVERWGFAPFDVFQTSLSAFNWTLGTDSWYKNSKGNQYRPWGNLDEVDIFITNCSRQGVFFFFALDHPALTYIFTLTTETLHKGG